MRAGRTLWNGLGLYHAGRTDITLTLDSLDVPLHHVMDFDLDALFTMVNTMRECSWVLVAKVVAAWQCAVEEAFYMVPDMAKRSRDEEDNDGRRKVRTLTATTRVQIQAHVGCSS